MCARPEKAAHYTQRFSLLQQRDRETSRRPGALQKRVGRLHVGQVFHVSGCGR
jgi:hypothetical protein